MGQTTDELLRLAMSVTSNREPREMDLLLSSGEIISSALVSMALRALGYQAISLTGLQAGIRTDGLHGNARIANVDTTRILSEINSGKIVVVAGFQGFTDNFDVTTLGRGGSDTSAVALAGALSAERCEVYTDVDGIFTADPRIVADARKIDEITYEEMLELAAYGVKMHPRSIELGSLYNVPIRISSSFSDQIGTLVHGGIRTMEFGIKVTGVAYDCNVSKITLRRLPDRPGVAALLFETLSAEGISVDTIVQNTSMDRHTDISFTVARNDSDKAMETVRSVAGELGVYDLVAESTLCKISIVGSGMLNAPGYASSMFRALADADINIDMITTSEIRITCIVSELKVEEGVRILHKTFGLGNP
jgi:aspartate kinase